VSVAATVTAAGGDAALVFRYVFLASWIFLAISLVALMLMEERPLRTSTAPAEPKAEPRAEPKAEPRAEPAPRPVAAE